MRGDSVPTSLWPRERMDFPRLASNHLHDARLFADRESLIASMQLSDLRVVAEVGVGLGDFSEFLLKTIAPEKFVAFDTFGMHELESIWGTPSDVVFGGLTHLEFYRRRLAKFEGRVVIEPGMSQDTLPKYPDHHFDLIYIDAAHDYDSVRQDAENAGRKLARAGVIVFNDYIMFDHLLGAPYGVVPVVNEVVTGGGWCVTAFALQQHMFCDIAIRRATQGSGAACANRPG